MSSTVFFAVAIALLTVISAGLAGHLAATKTWHKWVFWGTAFLIVILVYFQTRALKEPATASEIAAALHYPTAAEIAQAVVQIQPPPASTPQMMSGTERLPPVVKVIFKDSPLFTKTRQRNITKTINEAYLYLSNLGFPLEMELPPMGVSGTNVQTMSGVFPGTIYHRQFNFPQNSLDDSDVIREVYLSYVFSGLFHVFGPDAMIPPDFSTRQTVATLFKVYYASTIAGKNLDRNDWKGHKWMQALWEIRQIQGRDAADQYMLYTYKAWEDSAGPTDFEHVFLTRFTAGVWIKDNNGASIAVVNPILGKYKLLAE